MDLNALTPQERAKELQRRLGIAPKPVVEYSDDLIPDPGELDLPDDDKEIDTLIENLDIIDAYTRLIGKSKPEPGSKTDGIKVSCPLPGHPDRDPSAWLNTEKKTWYCGGCQKGGDIYDLAAIKFNYGLDQYKNKDQFPKLRKDLANEFGFAFTKGIGGREYVQPPLKLPPEIHSNGKVVDINTKKESQFELPDNLKIDWESFITKDTFLYKWMTATTVDDLPHEYYFFLGLQALGFAARRNVWLRDSPNVHPNLFICLYGPTGVGKSRSLRPYLHLLRSALEFTGDGDPYNDPTGVRILPSPNSAEALLDSFAFQVLDPSTNLPHHKASINGLLKVEEFASFVAKASRPGNTLKDMLIDLFDCHPTLTSHSRGSGKTIAKEPFCQVVTTTQPKAIHAFLRKTDTESGFLNRWVLAAGKSRRTPISYGSVKINLTDTEIAFRDVIVWSSATTEFVLEGAALDTWDQFFQTHIAGYKMGIKDMDTMASRIDLTLKKIIILLTINETLTQPTANIVNQAIELYNYLSLTYSMFGSDIIFNEVTDCQQKILAAIERHQTAHKTFPTRREILKGVSRKFDTEIQVKALRHLAELDIIQEVPPTKECPGTRYRYAKV